MDDDPEPIDPSILPKDDYFRREALEKIEEERTRRVVAVQKHETAQVRARARPAVARTIGGTIVTVSLIGACVYLLTHCGCA